MSQRAPLTVAAALTVPPLDQGAVIAGHRGLTREVLWSAGPRAHHRLSVLIPALPAPLKELVGHTEAAVGAAVLRGVP